MPWNLLTIQRLCVVLGQSRQRGQTSCLEAQLTVGGIHHHLLLLLLLHLLSTATGSTRIISLAINN